MPATIEKVQTGSGTIRFCYSVGDEQVLHLRLNSRLLRGSSSGPRSENGRGAVEKIEVEGLRPIHFRVFRTISGSLGEKLNINLPRDLRGTYIEASLVYENGLSDPYSLSDLRILGILSRFEILWIRLRTYFLIRRLHFIFPSRTFKLHSLGIFYNNRRFLLPAFITDLDIEKGGEPFSPAGCLKHLKDRGL